MQHRSHSGFGRSIQLLTASCVAVSAFGCADQTSEPTIRPPSTLPESVDVPSAEVVVGTGNGTLRKHVKVESFAITRFPITVRQYRECVEAGACSPPKRTAGSCAVDGKGVFSRTFDSKTGARDDFPVTCATPKQATGFCRWVGGRLPTIAEWMYGARGTSVQKYAWADQLESCDRHPGMISLLGHESCCKDATCTPERVSFVGHHPEGKSPTGMEDVLLTLNELVASQKDAPLVACREAEGCTVGTFGTGSIDRIAPTPRDDIPGAAASSFRCAWEDGAK